MTDVTLPFAPQKEVGTESFLDAGHTLISWLTTTDHKRIAILYAISITIFFFIGGIAIGLVRLELIEPSGMFLTSDGYNRLFTIHGIIMVWFFLVPSIPATMGNFLLPLMIGARDVAFPRLNLLSWYLYVGGALFTFYVLVAGGVDTGWTFYPPFSSNYSNGHVVAAAAGVFVVGFSSIATGVNFITTTHMLRCPGMTWFRMPLFVWAMYATSIIMILGTPVVAITLFLVAMERIFGFCVFNPVCGGDPLLFEHLFWFYSHPAVYIMILPSMGVVSEVIACFSRKRIFGYEFVGFSSLAIALLGFLVWGHHMFVTGESMYSGMVFSLLSFLIAVPSAIKVFNWTSTIYKGNVWLTAPMLYAMGFIGLFTIGGLTGLFLASLTTDVHLNGTYFVVAHFHYVMVGGMVMAFMGGLHFWWPKITGRMYSEAWSKFSALLVFVGFNLTFFPQFILGYLGMPRRYHAYPPEFQVLNVLSTAGASVLGVGYLIPMIYFLYSLKYGEKAGNNPWGATGLEWQIQSPPVTFNFEETPTVTEEAYNYGPVEEVVG